MEFVKHECGIAMVRLLKPREHYSQRYGDVYYGMHLLQNMLIRQYNRGQDGAGIGVIDIRSAPRRVYRMRQEGKGAVEKMAGRIDKEIADEREWGSDRLPYYGSLMLGHVRYSTTGLVGERFLHPFRHDHETEGQDPESILLCGNFHLINTPAIWQNLHDNGIEADADTDTQVLLEDIAWRKWGTPGKTTYIEEALTACAPEWDGGFVMCGIETDGQLWAIRDAHGIRPAYWYADDEKVLVASEKSAIALSAGVAPAEIRQLLPGCMLKVTAGGRLVFKRIIEEKPVRECVFERIYFSRADGDEITLERERLGWHLAAQVDAFCPGDINTTYLSFVPQSARSAFLGMVAYFAGRPLPVSAQELAGSSDNRHVPHSLPAARGGSVHFGRTIEKGKALRTFISTEKGRENLVEKTYDKVVASLPEGTRRIVIIDDSIVRGTTLKSSVLNILDTYGVEEIIVVSSTPQVRYPDFYGIDMSRLGELIAFRAAVELIKKEGNESILEEVYRLCKSALGGEQRTRNFVRLVYAQVSGNAISEEIARMVTPKGCKARIRVIYLSPAELRKAIPDHTGDWCFSGNYPTSGAYTKICQAYVNYYEGKVWER